MSEGTVYQEHGYQKALAHKITGIATTGTKLTFTLERPFNNWLLQVYGLNSMGASQAASAWTVSLKGGFDSEVPATILSHSNSSDSNGDAKTVEGFLAQYVEVDVSALTLGSAAEIVVVLMGMKQ